MGLDMYLTKRTYLGTQWEHRGVTAEITVKSEGKTVDVGINPHAIEEITESAIYWRKANHFHSWFVENVQEGVDDCGQYLVSLDQLKNLRDLCEEVINNRDKADKLLPRQAGFFFGGQDYDEYYFESVIETYNNLRNIIDNYPSGTLFYVDYYYSSSW
jgi:hypothetical protein